MVQVKICGIKSSEESKWAIEGGADALGFIFVPKSKRYIKPEEVNQITAKLPPFVVRVGVFANCSPNEVGKVAKTSGITAIQLHGNENPRDYVHLGLPLIKALKIKLVEDEDAFQLEEDWLNNVQGLLLDSEFRGQFGGTGRVLPWKGQRVQKLIREIKESGIPLILAGGLSPNNVQAGVAEINPYAVDVSSGVEAEGGKKSKELIQEFIRRAKRR